MSVPRRHHLVPQFLLRRFAKREQIAMVRRNSPHDPPIITALKKAAVHTDFYTLDFPDGRRSTEMESILSDIENEAAGVIRGLDTRGGFPPSREQKFQLSRFMAYQFMRGVAFRESIQQTHQIFSEFASEGPPTEQVRKALRERLQREPTDLEVEESRRNVNVPPLPSTNQIKAQHIVTMIDVAESRAALLLGRSWQLFKFPTPILITGDAPVVPATPFRGPVGLVNADEILFPIDPLHALVLWLDERDERIIDGDEAESRYINAQVALQCYSWIYFRPPHNPIADLDLSPRGPIVRRMRTVPPDSR
ncbi:MAG: DUF4238 domain-containing protein [Polyangiaceae bacterium]|nr:DUF4238 domain-containing protein [Polyangiaceae bacterium]